MGILYRALSNCPSVDIMGCDKMGGNFMLIGGMRLCLQDGFKVYLNMVLVDRILLRDIHGKVAQLLYGVSKCRTLIYTFMKPSESLSPRGPRLPTPTHRRTDTLFLFTIFVDHLSPSSALRSCMTNLLVWSL